MENEQKFKVEIDGIEKEASVIKILKLDGREYVIYSVDKGDETSDILASEIITNEEGYDELKDIEDLEIKKNIIGLVNIMFS